MGKGGEKDWESKCIWNQKTMVRKKRKLLKWTWIWYLNHVKVSECFTWWRVSTHREESFTPHAQETTFYSWSRGMWPLSYGQSAEAIYSWDWLYMFNDYLSFTLTHFVDCHFLIVIPLGWSLFIFGHPRNWISGQEENNYLCGGGIRHFLLNTVTTKVMLKTQK